MYLHVRAQNVNKILDALTGKALCDSVFVIREAARLTAKAGNATLDQESLDAALSSLPHEQKKSRPIGFVRKDS